MDSTSLPTQDPSSRKRPNDRSLIACRRCRDRKVRCDVVTQGQPCTSCRARSVKADDCVITLPRSRKRHVQQTLKDARPLIIDQGVTEGQERRTDHSNVAEVPQSTEPHAQAAIDGSVRSNSTTPLGVDQPYSIDLGSKDISLELKYQDSEGKLVSHRITLPREDRKPYSPEEMVFLQAKGVLSLPPQEVCETLVRSYFHNIHPWIPIIDANEYLVRFDKSPLEPPLLLTWAIFLAASHYITNECVLLAGFSSRLEMNQSYFERAKTLFSLDMGHYGLVFAQTAILLAHWVQSIDQDLFGCWHWLGVAIAMCESSKLKLDDEMNSTSSRSISPHTLWRRMWWACKARDGWLSLGFGKSLQMQEFDSGLSPLLQDELMEDIDKVPTTIKQRYMPSGINIICQFTVLHLELSQILRSIVTLFRSHKHDLPDLIQAEALEEELLAVRDRANIVLEQARNFSGEDTFLAQCQFDICHAGVLARLWSPYLLPRRRKPHDNSTPSPKAASRRYLLEAITASSVALETTAELDLVRFLKHSTLSASASIMQHLLSEVLLSRAMTSRIARQRFELLLSALPLLGETLWQAKTVEKFFRRALDAVTTHQGTEGKKPREESSLARSGHHRLAQVLPLAVSDVKDGFDNGSTDQELPTQESLVHALSWPWDYSYDWASTVNVYSSNLGEPGSYTAR